VPSPPPGANGSPISAPNDVSAAHWLPFQRSAREVVPASVKAQTFVADDAPAATTSSPLRPGNETWVQDEPVRFQAVGLEIPLKAHPQVFATATTAVKSPNAPLCTRLTMGQDALAGVAASAHADAAPVTASAAAVPTAAPRAARPHRRGHRAARCPSRAQWSQLCTLGQPHAPEPGRAYDIVGTLLLPWRHRRRPAVVASPG
jgi:hypothetical protein